MFDNKIKFEYEIHYLMFIFVCVGLGNIVLQLPILFAYRASQVWCQ